MKALFLYVLVMCGDPVYIVGINGHQHVETNVSTISQDDLDFINTIIKDDTSVKVKIEIAQGQCI